MCKHSDPLGLEGYFHPPVLFDPGHGSIVDRAQGDGTSYDPYSGAGRENGTGFGLGEIGYTHGEGNEDGTGEG